MDDIRTHPQQPQQHPEQPQFPPPPPAGPEPAFGGAPVPERPSHAPFVTPDGATVWPSGSGGGGGHGDSGAPPPPAPAVPPAPAASSGPSAAPAPSVPGGEPEPGPAPRAGHRRRRARGPVGLLAAVAVVAGVIGGGTGWAAGELADGGGSSGTTAVAGTNASKAVDGTVASVAAAVRPSVVEVRATSRSGESTGSGVVTTSDGEILTNNHVISGASSVEVVFSDGKTAAAEVVGTDPDLDMALLKARDVSGLRAARLGDSDGVKVGDQVVAIGSPEGLTGTVTSGIVSALDREVTVRRDDGGQQQPYGGGKRWPFEFGGGEYNGEVGSDATTYKALQTDASLNPGNSGGALIGMDGRIIGINSAMYAPSTAAGASGGAGSVGLGFAIPVNEVKQIMDDLRSGSGG
ncbi:S1C family serine protease [Streptomyces albus]|uniref:S1C family serine protease n=1 Tax=Streptomyces albus TaxID=1888 RepID=UPI0004C918C2|nr:trypsin-like peptidase domain-containing protein [Streptomyces albus]